MTNDVSLLLNYSRVQICNTTFGLTNLRQKKNNTSNNFKNSHHKSHMEWHHPHWPFCSCSSSIEQHEHEVKISCPGNHLELSLVAKRDDMIFLNQRALSFKIRVKHHFRLNDDVVITNRNRNDLLSSMCYCDSHRLRFKLELGGRLILRVYTNGQLQYRYCNITTWLPTSILD